MGIQNVPAAAENIFQKNIVLVLSYPVSSVRDWSTVIFAVSSPAKNMTNGKEILL